MRTELLILGGLVALLALLFFTGTTVTNAVIWDGSKPLKEVDLTGMQRLRQGAITVYFHPEQQALAEEVIRAFDHGWQLVQRRLGMDLGPFKVALVMGKEEEIGGVYIRFQGGLLRPPSPTLPLMVPPGARSLQDADLRTQASVYWSLPHEAVHEMIARKARALQFDRQARGLEDGLAEYVGYMIAKELASAACQLVLEKRQEQVEALLQQRRDRPTYDLTQEFLGHVEFLSTSKLLAPEGFKVEEVAGYGVSLAFWLQLAQKHGEGVIKAFWEWVSNLRRPSAKEAARILSELTGDDIWKKLQQMDLHEVLQTLERAAMPAKP